MGEQDGPGSEVSELGAANFSPKARMGKVLTSQSLFNGSKEIGIEHEGEMYRLRITRQGKLILTK